ncbi:MAG: sialidase family protein, partial [Planctomycetota bacterium]|nr:sialidase family protein [Planctomycetota bacterium]
MKKRFRRVETTLCGWVLLACCCWLTCEAAAAGEPSPTLPRNFNPGQEYADENREFQGIPSIARAPGGRLWATWYGGGKSEGPENYIMLATSGDDGQKWSDLKLVIDPPFRASEPGAWVDPQGRLWLMCNLYPEGLCGEKSMLWVIVAKNPDKENPTWSEPRLLARNLNCFNKPIVLDSGAWLWPVGSWNRANPSRPLLSADQGRKFKPGGPVLVPPKSREFDEYNVVQLRDGRLWLLMRTKGGPYEAFSTDGGCTWSPAKPHPTIKNTVARHFLTRLRSGKLLLVKHGAIDQKIGRSHLRAFVSSDDGQTWRGGLMLDERHQVSYP